MKKIVISSLLFCCIMSSNLQAQDGLFSNTMKDVTTVAVTGVGGAVLGLSTLSFVDEPKEHMSNIVIGAAIGVIIGVGVVAWSAATSGKDYIHQNGLVPDFTTTDRLAWHNNHSTKVNVNKREAKASRLPSVSFTFNY